MRLFSRAKNFTFEKRKPLRFFRDRRGFAGIDAAIMIAFILGLMIAAWLIGPTIMGFLFDQLVGGANGVYTYLLELPILDGTKPPNNARIAQWVGYAVNSLHDMMITWGLALFVAVLLVAGVCYGLESFRIVGEGTAMNIITSSIFTLILIYACRPAYNLIAGIMNSVVGWSGVGGSGLIITSASETDALAYYARGGGLTPWTGDPIAGFFSGVIIMIIFSSLILLIVGMGITRLLIVGTVSAILPLQLVLRLIPPLKRIADDLIQTLIGVTFASLMAAIFLHTGYIIIAMSNIAPISKTVVAIATMLAAAYMATFFAGRLGALFGSVATMASMAMSVGTGLALTGVSAGGGALAGGVLGAATGIASGGGRGAIGRAALAGMGAGAAMAAATSLGRAVTGAGATPGGAATIAAAPVAVAPAVDRAVNNYLNEYLDKKAGSTWESILYKGAASDLLPMAEGAAEHFVEELEGKSPKQVYAETAALFPEIRRLHKDPEFVGGETKKFLLSLAKAPKHGPEVAFSAYKRITDAGKRMSEKERREFINAAINNAKDSRERVNELYAGVYDPNLEKLDITPALSLDYFNSGVSEGANNALAQLVTYVRDNYDNSVSWDEALQKIGELGKRVPLNDEDRLGGMLANLTGTTLTDRQKHMLGHHLSTFLQKAMVRNPVVTYNMMNALDNAKAFSATVSNPAFREIATSDMKSYHSAAWLENTLNSPPPRPQQPQLPPPPPPPPSPPPQQQPSKPKKGKRVDLLTLQKEYNNTDNFHEAFNNV